jgi:predicted nucleic acid-binding protein
VTVLDASVFARAVTDPGPAGVVARRVIHRQPTLHAPAILTAEVTSALRGMLGRGVISEPAARTAARWTLELAVRLFPFEPFAARVWELRDNLTVYDAWYVALAEALGTELVTTDDRLRRASGPRCPVRSPEEALAAG